MAKHRNTRVTIVPGTKQLVLGIGRAFEADSAHIDGVKLTLTRRGGNKKTIDMAPYDVSEGKARFEIPCVFTETRDYSRGLYDGVLMRGDCVVGRFEVVKAPGLYVADVTSEANTCSTPDWCEPICEKPAPKPKGTSKCNGVCDVDITFEPKYLEDVGA